MLVQQPNNFVDFICTCPTLQDHPGEREACAAERQLHGGQRALQLLHHLRDAPEDPREAPGEEGRQELWAAGKQKGNIIPVFLQPY